MNPKNKIRKILLVAATALAVLFGAWVLPPVSRRVLKLCPVGSGSINTAQAVPAFARKYGLSCSQCHAAFPALNDYGREFKNNGYVRERAKETGVKVESGDMLLPQSFPWGGVLHLQPFNSVKDEKTAINPIHEIALFAADGSVAKNFSYFMELTLADEDDFAPGIENAQVGYHYNPYLNVLAGYGDVMRSLDSYQTISGEETHQISEGSMTQGLLSMRQQFMTVRGEVSKEKLGALDYAFGVGGGAGQPMGTVSPEFKATAGKGPLNYNFRVVADSLKGFALGAFYRTGGTNWSDVAEADAKKLNNITAYAVDGLAEYMGVTARAALVNTQSEEIATSIKAKKNGAYLEAFYTVKKGDRPWIVPMVRYDTMLDRFAGAKLSNLAVNLSHYPMENVRAFLQYSKELVNRTVVPGPDINNPLDSRVTAQVVIGF